MLPLSLTYISKECFAESTLQTIKIKENVQYVDYRAFQYCLNLKRISIPQNVNALYSDAFLGSGLEHIVFEGNEVKQIGNYCFNNCNLSSFIWPEKCKEIGSGVFRGCKNLSEFIISPNANIKNIYEDAFIDTCIESIDFSNVAITKLPKLVKYCCSRFEKPKNLKFILPFYF